MKSLLLIIMVVISFSLKAQNPVVEAKELGQQIKIEIEKADMTKPFSKQLTDKINIFHKKVEELKATNAFGLCSLLCGTQFAICVSSCGGGQQCVIFCSFQNDFCQLNCN